jgi:hypothetical protein
MKKLLTIYLLIATICTVNAQTKPTKEETIAFMNRTLKSTIGFNGIVEIDFNQNTYTLKDYTSVGAKGFYSSHTSSGIPWETLQADSFHIHGNRLRIIFSRNYRHKYQVHNSPEIEEFISSLDIKLPFDKVESFKKACIRLSEIAKEENKDPFKN